jgi:NADH-quinone oxidoreductase subunit L
MITHAFFKALLFLGSGSVIHGMHDEQDIQRMGGLRKYMPITCATFIVGWLAIAGVPPFSGFWSKDEILLFAYNQNPALWAVGMVTALLTAFYMSRQVFLVFFGEERFEREGEHAVHPHESPWLMTAPLLILAGLAVVAGFIQIPFNEDLHFLEEWLHPVIGANEAVLDVTTNTKVALGLMAVLAGLFGIALAARVYLQKRIKPVEPKLLAEAYYYDSSIAAFMGGPGQQGFEAVATFDAEIIDGAVNGVGAAVRGSGKGLRVLQTGFVRSYALGVAVGVVGLLVYFLTRGGVT